jgi:predicted ribosome quality control (RQC) complex YloA/Tae2 family protein
VLLLDDAKQIIQTLRPSKVANQHAGETYQSPLTPAGSKQEQQSDLVVLMRSGKFQSPSEAADQYFIELLAEKENAARIASARAGMRRQISQQQKLLKQLENDLRAHELPEQHKRIGDLLLANLSTATRKKDHVTLIDYFAEGAPAIDLEIDESASLPEEAARRFARYSRSKRAIAQIELRIKLVQDHLRELQSKQELFEQRISDGQGVGPALESLPSPKVIAAADSPHRNQSPRERVPGARRYISSDGLEILVGRTSKDNDNLTLKIARPNDLWLHAADYGGSHVVIRNSTRKEIPQRTLIEAAQLAAYFSQAKKDPKVDVHYTERKFVTKPKGAKLGLVRLSRFKNITVAPKEAGTKI